MKSNIFNSDFQDFLECFEKEKVEYVLVGGYSVILHGYNRTTGYMDLFVNSTPENYFKIRKSFGEFGMSLFDMTEDRFLDTNSFDVFEFCRAPMTIDILTKMKGVEFQETFDNCIRYKLTDKLSINVIHLNQLLSAKKASARFKDLDDIEHLIKDKK